MIFDYRSLTSRKAVQRFRMAPPWFLNGSCASQTSPRKTPEEIVWLKLGCITILISR